MVQLWPSLLIGIPYLPEESDAEMFGNDRLPITIEFVPLLWIHSMFVPLKDLSIMMSWEV